MGFAVRYDSASLNIFISRLVTVSFDCSRCFGCFEFLDLLEAVELDLFGAVESTSFLAICNTSNVLVEV